MPQELELLTLEMGRQEFVDLLEKCCFPGYPRQLSSGGHQRGIRLQAFDGSLVASASRLDDHVQAISTPLYVDPELDIFIKYRELRKLLSSLESDSREFRLRLFQLLPTELGQAPRSSGTATISLLPERFDPINIGEQCFKVILSEHQSPDISCSFLLSDSEGSSTHTTVPTYYITWINNIACKQFSESHRGAVNPSVVVLGTCHAEPQRTVINIADDWRISCLVGSSRKGL